VREQHLHDLVLHAGLERRTARGDEAERRALALIDVRRRVDVGAGL
jgi:hypothetical protein